MRVGDLARPCPTVQVTDSLGKAAEAMRKSGCPLLPVLHDGQVVGVIEESSLLTASIDSPHGSTVSDLMKPLPAFVPSDAPLTQAAWLMKVHHVIALPVVKEDGRLQGVITGSDVASVLLHGLRPSRIGGMATPLGVYLTTGTHRGGVGDFALILTGITMALCLLAARLMVLVGLFIADAFLDTRMFEYLVSGIGFVPPAPWGGNWLDVLPWLQMLLFFMLMRALPLTGYHGAEHQVVYAIERGEDLTPEAASRMPLEHPRCGTNLAALLLLLVTILFSNVPPFLMVALVIVTLLFWRQVGMLLQRYFTVKRPKAKQLLSGLRAGDELLRRFQNQPFRPTPIFLQVWNMGFLQVFAGAGMTFLLSNRIVVALGFPHHLLF